MLLLSHAYNTSHTLANRVEQEKDIKLQWAKESIYIYICVCGGGGVLFNVFTIMCFSDRPGLQRWHPT